MSMTDLETQIVSVPERARGLQIVTTEDYVNAGELLKTIKGLRAEIDQTFDPIIAKAHEAHKEALAQKKKIDAPLVEAEGLLKPRIAAYLTEQERLRREEELRLQKQAQEDAERRQLENAAILDDLGETEEANRLLEETPEVGIVVVGRTTPKVSGVSMSLRWSAELVDFMALVKAVAAGRAPIQCLKPDEVFLNRMATSMRKALAIPGVKAVSKPNISAGRK